MTACIYAVGPYAGMQRLFCIELKIYTVDGNNYLQRDYQKVW